MNIDNYLKQLTIDIDNQKLQETILNKSAKTTSFDFKIKNMTQSNPTQVSSFLKNDIIDKLNRLVDSVTAMRVYNFLISNNLMDTFLKSYEYLLNYKNYNVMSYNDIINYILSYASSSKGMLDFLKEDLKEKLKSKTDISQLKQLNKITTNANVKNKIKIASQKIPTQEKINKVQNIDILQQMINDADFLPDKAQVDKILSRTRRTKIEMKKAELMGFEDIRSLENKQTKLERKINKQAEEAKNIESQFPLEYSEKVTTESPIREFKTPKIIEPSYSLEYSEKVTTESPIRLKKTKKIKPIKMNIEYETEAEPEIQTNLDPQTEIQTQQQEFTDKYIEELNKEIQVDNKEIDIIEELNKKSQIEEIEESSQQLSQESVMDFAQYSSQEESSTILPSPSIIKSQIEQIGIEKNLQIEKDKQDKKKQDQKEIIELSKNIENKTNQKLDKKDKQKMYDLKRKHKLTNDKLEWAILNDIQIETDALLKPIVKIKNPKSGYYIDYGGATHKALTKPKKGETIATMSPIIWKDFIKS
jgi:hypothetical protein